jgi:hypothetical protein
MLLYAGEKEQTAGDGPPKKVRSEKLGVRSFIIKGQKRLP